VHSVDVSVESLRKVLAKLNAVSRYLAFALFIIVYVEYMLCQSLSVFSEMNNNNSDDTKTSKSC